MWVMLWQKGLNASAKGLNPGQPAESGETDLSQLFGFGEFFHMLTHYQTTNFRLFQTERVCRRQFQIWRKWQKVIQMGRKHSGKNRNCSLRAISPFPTVFSKGLFPRAVKRCHCVGKGKSIVIFHRLKIHNYCKMKKQFSYNIEWKCGQCRSEMRLHVLCSLILICTVQNLLVSLTVTKELKDQST